MVVGTRKGWIGIDLGAHAVKLAQLERQGGQLRLRDALVVPRQTIWDTSTEATSSMPEVQAGLSLSEAWTGGKAACLLSMAICDVRAVRLAPETLAHAADPRTAVHDQMAAIGDMQHRVFDYWDGAPTPRGNDAGEEVYVLSTASHWSQQVARDLGRCRLQCEAIDGLPLALARAVSLAEQDPEQPVAAVDLGYEVATFCIIHHRRPVFVRNLKHCGYRRFVETLEAELPVSRQECFRLLCEHGVAGTRPRSGNVAALIGSLLAGPLGRLHTELTKTLTYLKSHRSTLDPAKIWLFGGGATVEGLAENLRKTFELPVAGWQPHSIRFDTQHVPLPMLGTAIALSALCWEVES